MPIIEHDGYDVDWTDAGFPQIVRGGPMTLAEAKHRSSPSRRRCGTTLARSSRILGASAQGTFPMPDKGAGVSLNTLIVSLLAGGANFKLLS